MMTCPKCGRAFYPMRVEEIPCMCKPEEIRNLLADKLVSITEEIRRARRHMMPGPTGAPAIMALSSLLNFMGVE